MNEKYYKTWNASAICRSIVLLIIGTCPQARGDVYLAPRWHANYAANIYWNSTFTSTKYNLPYSIIVYGTYMYNIL